jgi:hypothetical protein
MHFQSHPFLSFSLLLVFWGKYFATWQPTKTNVSRTKDCYEKNPPKSPDFENIFPEIVI